MDQIDEFESMFKAAEREQYVYADVPIDSITIISDRNRNKAESLRSSVSSFLPRIEDAQHWRIIAAEDFSNVTQLLSRLDEQKTDLIITYRHLFEESLVPQHSLGVYLDVLTQVTTIPVLVLPGTAVDPVSLVDRTCERVMIVADHISGDAGLINYGARMVRNGGTLWLCHIEDDAVFDRYAKVLGRIPEIDTDEACRLIEAQLLKEANDYIETCVAELTERGPNVSYQSSVSMGHFLRQYRDLVSSHEIDLLVANTNDEDQMAMHGLAYSLSVELCDVPMLLL